MIWTVQRPRQEYFHSGNFTRYELPYKFGLGFLLLYDEKIIMCFEFFGHSDHVHIHSNLEQEILQKYKKTRRYTFFMKSGFKEITADQNLRYICNSDISYMRDTV